jgi:hypothetical protein
MHKDFNTEKLERNQRFSSYLAINLRLDFLFYRPWTQRISWPHVRQGSTAHKGTHHGRPGGFQWSSNNNARSIEQVSPQQHDGWMDECMDDDG